MALAVIPVIALIVAARHLAIARPQATEQPAALIEAPTSWVPFTADVAVYHPGQRTTLGRFYRSSDGSTRLESGPDTGEIKVIQIKNIAESRQYVFTEKMGWRTGPMTLPSEGYRPIQMKATMAGLHKYEYRLALAKGQGGSVRAAEGFAAYQHVDDHGAITFHVPELNFFQVIIQFPEGARTVYSNIEKIEPDASAFQPPSGVAVSNVLPAGGLTSEKKQ